MDEDNNPFGGSIWEEHTDSTPIQHGTAVDDAIREFQRREAVDDSDSDGDGDGGGDSVQQQQLLQQQLQQQHSYPTITETTHIRDRGHTAVVYIIRYNNQTTLRRYSEFHALHRALQLLFPTVIVPPIPEKHSVVKYLLNPLNATNDMKTIEKRMRLLTRFLQRCVTLTQVAYCPVFNKFMDPSVKWLDVMTTPPISILPHSQLQCDPIDVVKPSPLHLLLPTPHTTTLPKDQFEMVFHQYKHLTAVLYNSVKRQRRHLKGLVKDLGELGAYYNAFSLEHQELSTLIERTGQAIDINFIQSEVLNHRVHITVEEPLKFMNQTCITALGVLKFRKLKQMQCVIIETTIKRRTHKLDTLVSIQGQMDRLTEVLKQNADTSTTMANTMKVMDPQRTTVSQLERAQEIEQLSKELSKLDDCHRLILKDLEVVNSTVERNCQDELLRFRQVFKDMMLDLIHCLKIWLIENLRAWEGAKNVIESL